MGIELQRAALERTLEDAVALSRGGEALPDLWLSRVERLGQLGIRTYIAALGAAMLARATDQRVDSLAQDISAGPRGYSLRVTAKLLAERNSGRYHMGATGRWPLNNRPFLGGPSRIDEFTKISRKARHSYELFRDCLVDLNRASRTEALNALAAWLRVRMAVMDRERLADRQMRSSDARLSPAELLGALERFVRDDPEGGRRGQALVAAVLDCAFEDVVLQSINSPHPGDVRVRRDGRVICVVEVKQMPVTEMAATELSAAASHMDAPLALLVVMADRHAPLDRESLRRQAIEVHGVLLEVAESVRELVGALGVFSGTSTAQIVAELPGRYAARMREHGISERGQQRWQEILASRDGDAAGGGEETSRG